jgi:hypothetical protein
VGLSRATFPIHRALDMSNLKEHTKSVQRLLEAMREAEKTSGDPQIHQAAIEAALKAAATCQASAVTAALEEARRQVEETVSALLLERRTALAEAARDAGWRYTRLGEQDSLGEFYVQYSKAKVKILIGSEELTSTNLVDGRKLFDFLRQERQRLEAAILPRGDFFNALRLALAMAKADGKGSNGKVKVRELFPYLVVTRQLAHEAFRRKPIAKNFIEYSTPLLALELHKFGQGEGGWQLGEHRLVNQPPNMATQHEALQLPGLSGAQVLWLGIE